MPTKENMKNMFSFFDFFCREYEVLWKGKTMEMTDNYAIIENYLMIRMPDEVDHHKAADICRMADNYITHSKVENVVFDFEDTKFMDSSGIGIIMGRYKKISCFGGRVYVIHADQRVRRMLAASGMLKIVTIMD